MTVATLQLGVGTVYSFLIWIVGYNFLPCCGFAAPTKQAPPKITASDLVKMLPVAFCSAAAHSASVLALNAGSVSFGQIVKAGEPVFSALVNTLIYSKAPSMAKWLCLPVIVGGVVFSCLKPTEGGNICLPGVGKCYEIEFDMTALAMASLANLFAAIKGGENAKLMKTEGLKDRIGGVGNQFALTEVLGFFISLPVMFYIEGANFGKFVDMVKGDATLDGLNYNLIASGMTFYLYNELATMTIKKTGAVTASVANTAKRVIVIVGVAIVLGTLAAFSFLYPAPKPAHMRFVEALLNPNAPAMSFVGKTGWMALIWLMSTAMVAQSTLVGFVKDGDTGEPMFSASVMVDGVLSWTSMRWPMVRERRSAR